MHNGLQPSTMNEKEKKGEPKILSEVRLDHLRQISLYLLQLHNKKFAQNRLTPSQISELKSFFPERDFNNCEEIKKQDHIRLLANLYCLVLTKNNKPEYSKGLTEKDLVCEEPDIALHIIKQMASGEIAIEEVLQHPFHWSCFQKVHFLCRAVDYINGKNKTSADRRRALALSDSSDGPIPESGWVEELKLNKSDIKRLQKLQNNVRDQDKIWTGKEVIYNEAGTSADKDEQKYSVYELLRFFRNRYTHFYEDKDEIKACFGSYPEGYWKFFSSRFPKLFMHVYRKMKTYMCTKDRMGEFATDVY